MADPIHLNILRSELQARITKNPQYSLRAFAANLCVDPSALCKILAGKQPLSASYCIRILRRLDLTPDKKKLFLLSAVTERKRKEFIKITRQIETQDSDHDYTDGTHPDVVLAAEALVNQFKSDVHQLLSVS